MKENTSNKLLYNCKLSFISFIKIFTICSFLLIVSCKVRRQLITKPLLVDTTSKALSIKLSKLDAIRAGQTNFDTFSGRAHAQLNINGNSNDVTLNIRVKKDVKIWVSITAIAGIEAARALITPDSIIVINRLQGVYLKKPFTYVNTLAGMHISYKTLESLIVGNAIPELINENATLQANADTTTLTGALDSLDYKLVVGPGMRVVQTNLNNQDAGQSLQVINSILIPTGNRVIPSQIDIKSIVKDKKIQVTLHYIKTEFDQPLEFPFNIPARYSPVE